MPIGAAMTKVSREQFELVSNGKVHHVPTGATFSTFPCPNPDDAPSTRIENLVRADEVLENGDLYSAEELRKCAMEMLRELAQGK